MGGAARNSCTGIHVNRKSSFLWDKYPLAGWYGNCMFNLKGTARLVPFLDKKKIFFHLFLFIHFAQALVGYYYYILNMAVCTCPPKTPVNAVGFDTFICLIFKRLMCKKVFFF